jgi:hypothetical protein
LDGWSLSDREKPKVSYHELENELTTGIFDSRADTLLQATEAFARVVFVFPDLAFQRAVTYRNGSGDIMIAKWNIEGSSVKGSVILKDTPYMSLDELRLSRRDIVSRDDLTSFLSDILVSRKPPLNLDPGSFTVSLPSPPPGITSFSGQFSLSEVHGLRNCSIAGVMAENEWYLTFYVPPTYAGPGPYYHTAFVPERFPPLTELVREWGTQRIWSEVGKPADPRLTWICPRFAMGFSSKSLCDEA